MGLTREAILAAKDRKSKPVEVPEWGGTVHILAMSGHELEEWQEFVFKATEEVEGSDGERRASTVSGVRAFVLLRTIGDENGQRIFGDDDGEVLLTRSAPVLDKLFDEAFAWNRLAAEDKKELEENSDSAPTTSTGSNSVES